MATLRGYIAPEFGECQQRVKEREKTIPFHCMMDDIVKNHDNFYPREFFLCSQRFLQQPAIPC